MVGCGCRHVVRELARRYVMTSRTRSSNKGDGKCNDNHVNNDYYRLFHAKEVMLLVALVCLYILLSVRKQDYLHYIPFTISDLFEMYCVKECMTGHINNK